MYIIKKILAGIAASFLLLTALPLYMLKQYVPAVGFTLIAIVACRYVLRPKPTPPTQEYTDYTPPYILTNDDYDRIYGTGKYSGMDNIDATDELPTEEPAAETILEKEEPAAPAEPQPEPYSKESYERAMEAYRKMMENRKES